MNSSNSQRVFRCGCAFKSRLQYEQRIGPISKEEMKALIVEGSNTMRSVLCRILSMRGFEVLEAEDILRAIDRLGSKNAFDLLLIAWNPHEIEILEFIGHLRQSAAPDSTIILLAELEPAARELRAALLAGADDYLVRPFRSQEIDEKLVHAGFGGNLLSGSDQTGITCR